MPVHTSDFRSWCAGWLAGGLSAGGPYGEYAVADEVVCRLGEAVVEVCFEGALEALVGFAVVALPPLDDEDALVAGPVCSGPR